MIVHGNSTIQISDFQICLSPPRLALLFADQIEMYNVIYFFLINKVEVEDHTSVYFARFSNDNITSSKSWFNKIVSKFSLVGKVRFT
jgi:hypothetical protein